MKPKVLIVSYLFPPIGGGGVQRALKMAKYLNQYGWEPHILTVDENVYFASKDVSLLKQLPPEVIIHRAKQFDLIGKLTGNHKKVDKVSTTPNILPPARASLATRLKSLIMPIVKPMLKALKNRLLIPDDQILWYRNAVDVGMKVIQENNIQAIFSTSGPNTNHLVANTLKKNTGLPWVADFRDPWTDNMHRSGIWWREKIEARMERSVVQNANVVMTVTDQFLKGFEKKYPWVTRDNGQPNTLVEQGKSPNQKQIFVTKGVVVYNGYDIDDYNTLEGNIENQENKNKDNLVRSLVDSPIDNPDDNLVDNPADNPAENAVNNPAGCSVDNLVDNSVDNLVDNSVDKTVDAIIDSHSVDKFPPPRSLVEDNVPRKMRFAYTGIFYEKRNPRLLLQAIRELVDEGHIEVNTIELHFAGIFDYPGQDVNWRSVVENSMEKQVILHGQLPHNRALELLAASDALLLIADIDENAGAYIPGKLFEYIAIGKPILACSQRGESTSIIEELGNGIVVNPISLEEMKEAITQMYRNWVTEGVALPMPKDILNQTKKYQRHEQARMLAEELDRMIESLR